LHKKYFYSNKLSNFTQNKLYNNYEYDSNGNMTKITSTATEPENLQYFYLSDHLGSSSWITDKDGNALQHLSYLPFGEVFANQKASGSSFDAEFKFLGKELDAETGYTKTDNRYYWAEAGVFLSVDPLCDKYPMLTPYNYAGNNPLIFRDPSGLDIDPTTEKNVANYVNPNSKQYSPAFAEQYNSLKNDKNAVYSFNYKSEKWRDNGETIVGNVTYNGTNDKGQYMIGINYTDDVSTTGLSTQSPLLEETFHAVQFSKGDYGYLAGDGSTFALDIHDEATAKVFAAQNTQTTKYGLEKKLLNSFNKGGIEGVVDFMKKSSSLSKVYNSLENVPIGNVLKSISGGNKPYFKANGQSAIQGLIMQRPK
jgi:RHS repeat-associated protein